MSRLLVAVAVLFLAACDATVLTTVRPPRLPMADTTVRVEPPETIAVRYALILWEGLPAASPTLDRTREDAEERAQLVVGYARQPGQSFREVQTLYSDAPSTQLLLRRDDARLPSEVVTVAFGLRVGERSTAVATDGGFYVVSREDDPQVGPTLVHVRHVLIGHATARESIDGVTRSRDEARALAEEVHTRALAEPSEFAALAAEYSDEPGAAESGGDLGAVSRGQTVPTFERAAFALEVDAISAVVESPFGFHVIQRYR